MSGNSGKASLPAESRSRGRRDAPRAGKAGPVFGARMRDHTTVGVGGPAERIVFPQTVPQVRQALAAEREAGRRTWVLGAGSNLLVADGGIRGTVICLKRNMGNVLFAGGGTVVVDGGTLLPRLAVLCALSGLSGIEELGGIPGTVGGALSMNAGAYGRSIGDVVQWIEVMDGNGEVHRVSAREARFAYRTCGLPVAGLVVRAAFKLFPARPDDVFAFLKSLNGKRRANQPWGERTFGSTFRNPPEGESAGKLLERAGMKGQREGDACFSEKHANFIVNRGRATSRDVMRLVGRGREAVLALSGVALELEVRTWGDVHG